MMRLARTSSDSALRRATSINAGVWAGHPASCGFHPENVAENSRFWRFRRQQRKNAPDVAMNPYRACGPPRPTPEFPRATGRLSSAGRGQQPAGVATRMSTPRRSASICGLMLTPPLNQGGAQRKMPAIGSHTFFHLGRQLAASASDQGSHGMTPREADALACAPGAAAAAGNRPVLPGRLGAGQNVRPSRITVSPAPAPAWVACSLHRRQRASTRPTGRDLQTT